MSEVEMFDPPSVINVCYHGGFIAVMHNGDTLWRPCTILKSTFGTIVEGTINRTAIYQMQKPIISALYCIPQYKYQIKIWWDVNGKRIA